jgi:predicted TIM-barrel fold metal-dependent hydrolase
MTVDIHGHVTSPELFRRLPMPPSLADIDGMIEQKAALGISTTIVGSPVGAGTMVPVPGLDNYEQPVDKLESFHDWVAETVRAHPGSLKAYVYTNPYGGAELLERTARRLEQDEYVGLIVNTSVRGRFLDDPTLDGFFALAAERRAPVLLHPPAEPVGSDALGHLGLVEHVARPADVTLGVAAILLAGWLEKYSELRLVVSNAGGALPLLREKLDLARRRPAGLGGGPPNGAATGPNGTHAAPNGTAATDSPLPTDELLRRLYVDTATPSPLALAGALQTFGADRMLFGTDSPPLTAPLEQALARVTELHLSTADVGRVLSGNARQLFGLVPSEPEVVP